MGSLGNKAVFARNLQRHMDTKGITRNELCEALGFNYSTVAEWLSASKYPRIDKIEMLANYFGVQKSALIEEPGVAPQHEVSAADIKFALFGGDADISDAQYEEVKRFAQFVKERDKGDK